MAVVPIKWQAMTLQEKLNIIQKAEENPNNAHSDVCYFYTTFRWFIMICVLLICLALK
jgi:hypothetical protein